MTRGFRSLALGLAFALGTVGAFAQNALPPISSMFSTPIAGTVASAAKLIANVSGKAIYVTNLILSPGAGAVVTFTTGTGSACTTGTTTPLSLTFATANPVNFGDGNGVLIIVPKSTDLCIATATAIAPGSIGYAQF